MKTNKTKILSRIKTLVRELRKVATIESVGSSTRIEGVKLTDEEIEKLLKSVKITRLESRDEQEVVGYYEALQIILDNYEEVRISENYIHQLHEILLKHSHKDQSHKGKYKTLPNQVIANYPDGTQKIIFETTPPHLVSGEMQQLLAWTGNLTYCSELKDLLKQRILMLLLFYTGLLPVILMYK